jgi:RNA polymerase sigma-54 factor
VEKFFEDYMDDRDHRRTRSSEIPEMPPLENTLTQAPDLYDYLSWQLHMSVSDELVVEIGEAIVHNLDEDGMLEATLEEIANLGPFAMEEGRARAWRSCRPRSRPGVAARDLSECLRLQLRHLGLENSPTDVMIRDHMKKLQGHQYLEIGRQMGLTPDEVSKHVEIIKNLDPAAGLALQPRQGRRRSCPTCFIVKEGESTRSS